MTSSENYLPVPEEGEPSSFGSMDAEQTREFMEDPAKWLQKIKASLPAERDGQPLSTTIVGIMVDPAKFEK